jgi:hypothetical protein
MAANGKAVAARFRFAAQTEAEANEAERLKTNQPEK